MENRRLLTHRVIVVAYRPQAAAGGWGSTGNPSRLSRVASSRPPRRRADRGPRRGRVRTKPTLSGPRSRDSDGSAGDVVKATGPADVLGILPFVLGFHPAESLVVVALDGPRSRIGLTIRVDLPPVGDSVDHVVADVVGILTRNRAREVLLVAYAIRAECSDPLLRATLRALAQRPIVVRDAWRADGSRWSPCCVPILTAVLRPARNTTRQRARPPRRRSSAVRSRHPIAKRFGRPSNRWQVPEQRRSRRLTVPSASW